MSNPDQFFKSTIYYTIEDDNMTQSNEYPDPSVWVIDCRLQDDEWEHDEIHFVKIEDEEDSDEEEEEESEVKFDPTRYVCVDDYCGILNPYSSSCGRFRIDPYEEYGLTNDDLLYFFKDQEYLDFLKNDYGNAYMDYIEEETEKRGQDYCPCDEHGCKKKKD